MTRIKEFASQAHRYLSLTAVAIALVAVLVGGLFLAIGWQHTNHKVDSNQRKSDQRWCSLLDQITFPRTTQAGERFNAALRDLEREFGCHVS